MNLPSPKLEDYQQELLDEACSPGGSASRRELNAPLRGNVAARQCMARLWASEQVPPRALREESLVAMRDLGSTGSISLLPRPTKAKRRAPWFSWQPFRRGFGRPTSLQMNEVALGSNPPRRNSPSI